MRRTRELDPFTLEMLRQLTENELFDQIVDRLQILSERTGKKPSTICDCIADAYRNKALSR